MEPRTYKAEIVCSHFELFFNLLAFTDCIKIDKDRWLYYLSRILTAGLADPSQLREILTIPIQNIGPGSLCFMIK